MTEFDKLVRETAKEFGLTPEQVKIAVQSQYNLVALQMQQGTLLPVRLDYLGVFSCKPGRLKALKKKNGERANKNRD